MSFSEGCHVLADDQAVAIDLPTKRSPVQPPVGSVRVEIDATVLLGLLEDSRLCAADMRCLDCASKHCLRRLLLTACARQMGREVPLHNPPDRHPVHTPTAWRTWRKTDEPKR